MSDNQVIPEAAVEAAWDKLLERGRTGQMSDCGCDAAAGHHNGCATRFSPLPDSKPKPDDVVQVCMTSPLFNAFQGWLHTMGLDTARSQFDPEDIPTYTVVFK